MTATKWVQFCCFAALLISYSTLAALGQSQSSQMPELIRDTDVAEGRETGEVEPAKEFNPLLAEQNINIGNFYFKKKNYGAAIQRYLQALEYHPDSIPAHEALARAYEKSGDIARAIQVYKDFINRNPGLPKSSEFQLRIAKLEKKSESLRPAPAKAQTAE